MPTWGWILAVCGGFLVLADTAEKIQSIIRKAKAPQKEEHEENADKFARDYKRLNEHDKEIEKIRKDMDYIMDSLLLQTENDMVILEHMRTNNSTGKIAEREKAIKEFLLKHQKLSED